MNKEDTEQFGLKWARREQALAAAHTPASGKFHALREDSVDFDTTDNLFIEGDNLDVLKLLKKDYSGQVKMIYIDPPYNTGSQLSYKDNFRNHSKRAPKDNEHRAAHFHTEWLNMMYPRLHLAHDLLRDDGIIFISIDDNEHANLKMLCDMVFGKSNFMGCFIRKRRSGCMDSLNNISINHDYIIAYSKAINKFRGKMKTFDGYANPDNDPRGAWKKSALNASHSPTSVYALIDPETGYEFWPPKGRAWRFCRATMDEKVEEGRIIFPKIATQCPAHKLFRSESKSPYMPVSNILDDYTMTNAYGTKELKKIFNDSIFSFPKPTALIRFFIQQVTSGNDIVMDFFAGSATTAHACMQANAQDGSARRYILVQMPEPCAPTSPAGKAGYATIADIAKERIRRSGAQVKADYPDAPALDIGFKVLSMGAYHPPIEVNRVENG